MLPALIFFGADIRVGPSGSRLCAALGDLSYPLYVLHFPLLSPLFGSHVAQLAQHAPVLVRLFVPVYIALLAAAAWAVRAYIDAPLGRWLTRRYNRKKQAEDVVSALPMQAQLIQS